MVKNILERLCTSHGASLLACAGGKHVCAVGGAYAS